MTFNEALERLRAQDTYLSDNPDNYPADGRANRS
jgi:hypothetical protein